ncbi:hypothetical protein Hanom_Chr07g00606441 [Helianthus anomalus]
MLIFHILIEIFYIYYVWPGLARTFFSARVFRPWHAQLARSATALECPFKTAKSHIPKSFTQMKKNL